MKSIRIAGIVEDSITDGPGLRTTIFTQGCLRNCEGCHNKQTHSLDGGKLYSVEELYNIIVSNPIIDGVTISGGEPMLQAQALIPLLSEIKQNNLHIAIYTGYTLEELLNLKDNNINQVLILTDTLIDGEFKIELKSLKCKFKGSTNQRIIDVKKSLESSSVVVDNSPNWN